MLINLIIIIIIIKYYADRYFLIDKYFYTHFLKNNIYIYYFSDDTLKQKGERFGAADVYFASKSPTFI